MMCDETSDSVLSDNALEKPEVLSNAKEINSNSNEAKELVRDAAGDNQSSNESESIISACEIQSNVVKGIENEVDTKTSQKSFITSETETKTLSDSVNSKEIPSQADSIISENATKSKIVTTDNEDTCSDRLKLFVGGLSWETTENDMKEYFSQFGSVKTCTIKMDKMTGHSRGFGFVIFDNEDAINNVLLQENHVLCKKKIDPKRAKPSHEPIKKIFVGGLSPDASEVDIKEYFSQFGKIESIDLPFDTSRNKRKAYIFVKYATETDAKKACNPEKQNICGKMCDVRLAVPKEPKSGVHGGHGNGWQNWDYDNYQYDQSYDYDYGYAPDYSYGQNYDYNEYGPTDNSYGGYNNSYYSHPPPPGVANRPWGPPGGKVRGGYRGRPRGYHPYR